MPYERLTKRGGYTKELDLTQEYGYSIIYQRLSELEDKIEDEEREREQKMKAQYKVGDELFYVKQLSGKWVILCVPVKTVYIGKEVVSYGLEVGQFSWVRRIRQGCRYLFPTREAAEARLAELKGKKK